MTIGTDVIRWIFRLLLTMLAARLRLLATRRAAAPAPRGGTQSFHPGLGGSREKTPRLESQTNHPIDDADYEELPRSSV